MLSPLKPNAAMPMKDRKIVLGVTGSIAAYKAADLCSRLVRAGAQVDVIVTENATRFVGAATFAALTQRQVITGLYENNSQLNIDHVELASKTDVIVIAPATANTIAKIANGISDDALGATILATKAPVIIAPAMDGNMFNNQATQHNVATLMSRGLFIAGPAEGRLASGIVGTGRVLETEELLGVLAMTLGKNGDLEGKHIVVSAGGTQQDIDSVRSIKNKSSGKMGYAVAEAARDRGASVTLISAETNLANLVGVHTIKIHSAIEMQQQLQLETPEADAVIMAAAVADWRPENPSNVKVKKRTSDKWFVELTKNPDIIAGIKKDKLIKVGFAAESEDLIENATYKITQKNLDFIVANNINEANSGFGTDTNKVTIIDADGTLEKLPLMSKYEVGNAILDRVKTGFHN